MTTFVNGQWLKYKYGLTAKDFLQMVEDQKGLCAICHNKPTDHRLVPDHDHGTGVLRKLLCNSCNTGLGLFKDDPKLLAYALVYLEEHGKKF